MMRLEGIVLVIVEELVAAANEDEEVLIF